MAVQTYCTRTDIDAIWSVIGVTMRVDDDESGVAEANELAYVTAAIESAASDMNLLLGKRYVLSDLVGNDWCRFCNADLAACEIAKRRGNGVPPEFDAKCQKRMEMLESIAAGNLPIPGVVDSLNHSPALTNYQVELWRRDSQIRRDTQTSTGGNPADGLKHFPALDY